MDVPPGQLFVSWLEASRNIPASASQQGETGLKIAKEFVGASKGIRVDDEDSSTIIQSLKCISTRCRN